MLVKKKICACCMLEKVIWKRSLGQPYCKYCWTLLNRPAPISKQRAPIKKVSDKLRKDNSTYAKERKVFLSKNEFCVAKLPGCSGRATDVHHTEGRGIKLLVVDSWIALCRACHQFIENNPLFSKEMDFSRSRLTS